MLVASGLFLVSQATIVVVFAAAKALKGQYQCIIKLSTDYHGGIFY